MVENENHFANNSYSIYFESNISLLRFRCPFHSYPSVGHKHMNNCANWCLQINIWWFVSENSENRCEVHRFLFAQLWRILHGRRQLEDTNALIVSNRFFAQLSKPIYPFSDSRRQSAYQEISCMFAIHWYFRAFIRIIILLSVLLYSLPDSFRTCKCIRTKNDKC